MQSKTLRGNSSFTLLGALGLSAACLIPYQATAAVVDGVLIDDFVVSMTNAVEAAVPPTASNYEFVTNATTAIGGQRGLYVEKTAGGNGERVRSRVNPEGADLLRMTIDDARGLVRVIWDGDAANQAIDFNGLLGLDLTAGLLDPFFQFDFTFSDIGGPINLTVYQNGGAGSLFASGTVTAPAGIPSGSSVLVDKAFSSFILNGATTLDNIFTNVGAMVMEINATALAQEGWDMRLDLLTTRGTEVPPADVPVPATLLLLGAGLLGLRVARRDR